VKTVRTMDIDLDEEVWVEKNPMLLLDENNMEVDTEQAKPGEESEEDI